MSEQPRWIAGLAGLGLALGGGLLTEPALANSQATTTAEPASVSQTEAIAPLPAPAPNPSTDPARAPKPLSKTLNPASATELVPGTTVTRKPGIETEVIEPGSIEPNSIEPETAKQEPIETVEGKSLLAQTPRVCSNQLAGALSRIIDAPAFRSARWGIRVETLAGNNVLFDRNSTQALIPASNMKLFVTAAALQLYDGQTPLKNSNLGTLVRTINVNSNNGYADSLFRSIGGSGAVQRALAPLGVNRGEYRMSDGSGLSRSNAVQPRAFVHLLESMTEAKGSDIFRSSLPIAGQTGTLRRRFRNTPVQGRVSAKTGTLRGVRALSGYMEHPLYNTLVFSVLVNQPGQDGDTLVSAVDRVVLTLAQMRPCDGWDTEANPMLDQPTEPDGTLRPLLPWWRPGVSRPNAPSSSELTP